MNILATVPAGSLVSLWKHPTDTDRIHFLCGGVLVGPRHVLTVGHVFDDRATLWVRPNNGELQTYPLFGSVHRHPQRDAALFQLEVAPRHTVVAVCDRSTAFEAAKDAFRLNGSFRGQLEPAQDFQVLNFEAAAGLYFTNLKQPKGHSGSAVSVSGHLWGIASAHFDDPNIHRGCVLSVQQLWDGFLATVEGVRDTAGGARQGASVTTPPAQPDPLQAQFLAKLRELFAQPPLAGWGWAQPRVEGVPAAAVDLLAGHDRHMGKDLLSWLCDELVPALELDLNEGSLRVDAAAARRIRRLIFNAVDVAAKLCMDPAQRQALAGLQARIEVPVLRPVAASLAFRPDALHALAPLPDSPTQAAKDRYAVHQGLEVGEGADQRLGLASIIASMHSSKNPTTSPIVIRTDVQLAEWRGFLNQERDQKRGRCLFLDKDRRDALASDTVSWLHDFGVSVVVLMGDTSGFFWFDEDRLVAKVQFLLTWFATRAEWKDTHAS